MYFAYISPMFAEIGTYKNKKSEYDSVLSKVQELNSAREAAIASYNSIPGEDIDKLNKILPNKFDPILFLNDLGAITSKDGMNLTGFQSEQDTQTSQGIVNSETEVKPFITNTANIKVTGKLSKFLPFLKDIESSLRLMDVTGLQISGTGTTKPGQEQEMQFTLVIKTYSLQ